MRYIFEFTTKTGIPDGGSVKFTFPTEYNLVISRPPVRVDYPDFKNSAKGALSHFYSANQLRISNIGEVPIGSSFRLIFNGVRNPDRTNIMSDWFMDTLFNEYSLTRHDNFMSIALENKSTPTIIEVLRMIAFPTNADAIADYTFVIQPRIKLSQGSEIYITFPD